MLRTCVRPAALLRRVGNLLLFAALSSPLLSQAAPSSISNGATTQSDAAAIRAMQNVIVQSGGEAAWRGIRSAEEAFTVTRNGDKSSRVQLLLDDWSLDTTRYRRKVQGQSITPTDHIGEHTFVAKFGTAQYTVQEFDQARTLIGHLPGAAAEIMLRRKEYSLKISTTRQCSSGNICVDVFRAVHPNTSPIPEQEWTIAVSNGLPISVRLAYPRVGGVPTVLWEEVRYLSFRKERGLVIPASFELIKPAGWKDTWNFISLKENCGFDTARFDTEVAQ